MLGDLDLHKIETGGGKFFDGSKESAILSYKNLINEKNILKKMKYV